MPDVVATRVLTLTGDVPSEVRVAVNRPTAHGDDYRCEFSIVGLTGHHVSYSMGVDSTQALLLAFEMIGARLYTSEEGSSGRLCWAGSRDLGFPVPAVISDLRPRDK